jgi:hypothetical protein
MDILSYKPFKLNFPDLLYLGVLTMIFLLVLSLYRPGEESGGVVKAPTLLTRTNFFVPIFRNFVFELSDLDTIGLLIF